MRYFIADFDFFFSKSWVLIDIYRLHQHKDQRSSQEEGRDHPLLFKASTYDKTLYGCESGTATIRWEHVFITKTASFATILCSSLPSLLELKLGFPHIYVVPLSRSHFCIYGMNWGESIHRRLYFIGCFFGGYAYEYSKVTHSVGKGWLCVTTRMRRHWWRRQRTQSRRFTSTNRRRNFKTEILWRTNHTLIDRNDGARHRKFGRWDFDELPFVSLRSHITRWVR